METVARIVWFEDRKGYGFARTSDGKQLFVHRNNFVYRGDANEHLVEGSEIVCQVVEETDDFTTQLNQGHYRDADMNPRNPRRKTDRHRCPRALKIRLVRPEAGVEDVREEGKALFVGGKP